MKRKMVNKIVKASLALNKTCFIVDLIEDANKRTTAGLRMPAING